MLGILNRVRVKTALAVLAFSLTVVFFSWKAWSLDKHDLEEIDSGRNEIKLYSHLEPAGTGYLSLIPDLVR